MKAWDPESHLFLHNPIVQLAPSTRKLGIFPDSSSSSAASDEEASIAMQPAWCSLGKGPSAVLFSPCGQ